MFLFTMNNTSNSDISFSNFTRDELETELYKLKTTNTMQLKLIEDYEQQLYDTKRHLATSKAMEEHLSAEIELLNSQDNNKSEQLLKKIAALEEEVNTLKEKTNETIQQYEIELEKKDTEIEKILESVKSSQNITIITKDEIDKYTDEIDELKSKVNELTDELVDLELKYKDTLIKITMLENKNTELNNDLMGLRECLNAKNVELQENKEIIQNLQDDLTVIQIENDKLKSVPSDMAAKGNSLFAEVNDNRVKLQKHMQVMKKQFLEMQLKYSNKSQELQKLHLEYAALIKEIENNKETCNDFEEVINTYKKHFENLNDTIKSLEKELENQKFAFNKLITGDMKYAMEMITATRSEIGVLQRKLNAESLGLSFSEHSHFETKKELQKCQMEVMKLRAYLFSLKQDNDETDIVISPPADDLKQNTWQQPPNSILRSSTRNSIPPEEKNIIDLKENTWTNHSNSMLTHVDDSLLDDSVENSFENNDINKCNFNLSDEKEDLIEVIPDKNEIKENIDSTNTEETKPVKNKKVSFTADTLEPKIKNRIGRKVINIQPIQIPSIKKQ